MGFYLKKNERESLIKIKKKYNKKQVKKKKKEGFDV